MSIVDCDRTPCPAAAIGDQVSVEFDPFRKAALGFESMTGRVSDITPYLHGLVVGKFIVGGHASTDVVRVVGSEARP